MFTAHAMLVVWGLYARQIGLAQALQEVLIPQRSRTHTPQTKLIEFLVAILGGCAYLQDISQGVQPLDHDGAVAQAWGQSQWADYSGVSRTLAACTQETVTAVRQAVARVSQPFIDREVVLALHNEGCLTYDGDLTGRPVSPTSTTYEGAAFGWMDDAVQLGYQAALVSMRSPTYGRLWLSVTPHPGDTVSSSQAEALILAAEARTGARPWRRTDLLAGRIHRLREKLHQAEEQLQRRWQRYQQVQNRLQEARQQESAWQDQVASLGEFYQRRSRQERPHSHLAQARQKVGVYQRRCQRREHELQRLGHLIGRQEERIRQMQDTLALLETRYARFIEDNRMNRAPIRAVFRLDAGFGCGENIALLIEMGYDVSSKAISNNVTQAMRQRLTAETTWTRVGETAEMVAWKQLSLRFCPYPLDVALEHFTSTRGPGTYATLLHYGDDPATQDLPGWFHFYNGRQLIEAGVKEGKQVFQMHHLKVRSAAGLAIQEEFAVLAANLVRWAAQWLYEQSSEAQTPFNQPQPSVKQMVRVAANSLAWVVWHPEGYWLLRFDALSSFAGVVLRIGTQRGFQLPLPLFKNDDSRRIEWFGH